MDLWGPLSDPHPSLYFERFLGLLGQMGGEVKAHQLAFATYFNYTYIYIYTMIFAPHSGLDLLFPSLVGPAAPFDLLALLF